MQTTTTGFVPAKKTLGKEIWKNRALYIMALPMIVYVFIFNYIPLYGIVLAFKDFKFNLGIMDSPIVDPWYSYFERFFTHTYFEKIMVNTLAISFMKIITMFVFSVVLALVLNEIKSMTFKKVSQTALYLPHFMSWTIVVGFLSRFLSLDYGLLNEIKVALVGGDPILWLGEPKYFWGIIVLSNLWKEVGWGSILYIAGIAGIDQSLYESASLDGAGKLKQAWYITVPSIAPIMGISLTMSIAGILYAGFDQVWLLKSAQTYDVAMIIDTYVMDIGLKQGQYGYATAVSLFQGAIGFTMLLSFNYIAKRYFSISLW